MTHWFGENAYKLTGGQQGRLTFHQSQNPVTAGMYSKSMLWSIELSVGEPVARELTHSNCRYISYELFSWKMAIWLILQKCSSRQRRGSQKYADSRAEDDVWTSHTSTLLPGREGEAAGHSAFATHWGIIGREAWKDSSSSFLRNGQAGKHLVPTDDRKSSFSFTSLAFGWSSWFQRFQ